MSKIAKKILFSLIFIFCISSFAYQVNAVAYQPLVPDARIGSIQLDTTSKDLGSFLDSVFQFGIAIAIILAVIMVIIGGLEYMTSESPFGKGDGKERISAAIGGLILALSTILIFNEINPNIANTSLSILDLSSEGITDTKNNYKVTTLDNGTKVLYNTDGSIKGYDTNGDGEVDYKGFEFGDISDVTGDFSGTSGKSTYYGYPGDPYLDSKSAEGIGSFTYANGVPTYFLQPGDLSISPDIEAQFTRAGIGPRDEVLLFTSDGRTIKTRWMDRTDSSLTGRFDFFSPTGPQKDFKIQGFQKVTNVTPDINVH